MALSLLTHHLTQKDHQLKPDEWDQLQGCTEDLRLLSETHQDSSVSSVCARLRESIVTRGAVSVQPEGAQEGPAAAVKEDKKVEVMPDSYRSALADASDNEVPVRGHGLIVLTRLVEARNAEAVEDMANVMEIFRENLKHKDTYIYLQVGRHAFHQMHSF